MIYFLDFKGEVKVKFFNKCSFTWI